MVCVFFNICYYTNNNWFNLKERPFSECEIILNSELLELVKMDFRAFFSCIGLYLFNCSNIELVKLSSM